MGEANAFGDLITDPDPTWFLAIGSPDGTASGHVAIEDLPSAFDYTGSGSPEGVQAATVGKSYVDTTNGALYWKENGSGDTGWTLAGGNQPSGATLAYGPGLINGSAALLAGNGLGGIFSDVRAQNSNDGTGNGLYWNLGASDGQQSMFLGLGASDEFGWEWNADGTTKFPGALKFDDGTRDYRITAVSGTMQLITRNHADPDAESSLNLSEASAILAVSTDTLGADVTIGPASVVIGFQGVAGLDVERFGGDTYVGFYGVTPVVQAAHPTVLADVIAILTDLGLCA